MDAHTINPYAALAATADLEFHNGSSSSGSAPSTGSSASAFAYNEMEIFPRPPSRSGDQSGSGWGVTQQHAYRSQGQAHLAGFGVNHTPTCRSLAACDSNQTAYRTAGCASIASTAQSPIATSSYQNFQAPSLIESSKFAVVQKLAFGQSEYDSNSTLNDVSAGPFTHNSTWPVLVSSRTQYLQHSNNKIGQVWTRKMIEAALNCMEELIRITCRRKPGWDKTVADIPLPAQEALLAFPDLSQQYDALKRDAKEARAGGRPHGY